MEKIKPFLFTSDMIIYIDIPKQNKTKFLE